VEKAGQKVAELEYEVNTSDIIPNDITPGVGAEDFDMVYLYPIFPRATINKEYFLGMTRYRLYL